MRHEVQRAKEAEAQGAKDQEAQRAKELARRGAIDSWEKGLLADSMLTQDAGWYTDNGKYRQVVELVFGEWKKGQEGVCQGGWKAVEAQPRGAVGGEGGQGAESAAGGEGRQGQAPHAETCVEGEGTAGSGAMEDGGRHEVAALHSKFSQDPAWERKGKFAGVDAFDAGIERQVRRNRESQHSSQWSVVWEGGGAADVQQIHFAAEQCCLFLSWSQDLTEGMSRQVGKMDVNVNKAMAAEHTMSEDSEVEFFAENTKLWTTPSKEWLFVMGMGGGVSANGELVEGERPEDEVLAEGRNATSLTQLMGLVQARSSELTMAELVALRLYTGPMVSTTPPHCIVASEEGAGGWSFGSKGR
jgi:hypothetical protein